MTVILACITGDGNMFGERTFLAPAFAGFTPKALFGQYPLKVMENISEKMVVFVGKAAEWKRQAALFHTMATLEKEFEDLCRLVCVAHHSCAKPLALRTVIQKRVAEGLPQCPLYCFVHGTALRMYRWELGPKETDEQESFPMRFHKMICGEKLFDDQVNGVNACLVISNEQKDGIKEIFPTFPQERVIVAPNGINVERFKPREKALTEVMVEQTRTILWPAVPSEGLAERANWLSRAIVDYSFGARLLGAGLSLQQLQAYVADSKKSHIGDEVGPSNYRHLDSCVVLAGFIVYVIFIRNAEVDTHHMNNDDIQLGSFHCPDVEMPPFNVKGIVNGFRCTTNCFCGVRFDGECFVMGFAVLEQDKMDGFFDEKMIHACFGWVAAVCRPRLWSHAK